MMSPRRWLQSAIIAVLLVAASTAAVPARADILADIATSHMIKVCIWPDYVAISHRDPRTGELSGIDIDLSAALADDLRARIDYIDSSFATFIADLTSGKCQIAMFGIAVTTERAKQVVFSEPYLKSDILAVTTKNNPRVKDWADIDQPGRVVAVQVGTYMETVMREKLKFAELKVIVPPMTREREIESGRADVFMTDFPYTRRLIVNAAWAKVIEPPTPIFPVGYAYAIAPGDPAWAARINQFVAEIRRDGRLAAAAKRAKLDPIALTAP